MLVDDGGADVSDFETFGEPVDDKRVERVGVGDGDVNEEILAAGNDEHGDCLGQGSGEVAERLDPLSGGGSYANGDQSFDGPAEGG